MNIREGVADALVANGVEVVFALMGDGNQDLICDLGERCGVRIVQGRHEQGVVGMADGYARFAGKPGVATVTQGPGLTNAGTSLVVANRRHVPVLLLAGDTSLGDLHNPQLFDQKTFAQLMAANEATVDSARGLAENLAEAFEALRSQRPFVLSLPANVQESDLPEELRYQRYALPAQRPRADDALVGVAVRALTGARRPAILAGRGAVVSNAGAALRELGEELQAPLMTTLLANGLFAGHALDAGVCGGLGDGRSMRALEHCDLVLAVGAELNQWTTHFGEVLTDRRLVQIDSDPAAFGVHHRPDVALLGDATATVEAIAEHIRESQAAPRESDAGLISSLDRSRPLDDTPYMDTDHSIDPRHVLSELDRLLPADRRVVIGGGHVAQVACQTLHAFAPRDWTCTSIDFGALGQGLSVAIGACFARPGERVTHVTADGDFMMGLAEFDTAARYSLPLTIVVLNDQSMGQERHNLVRKELPTSYADYQSPDFVVLASAFGATGYRIDTPGELDRLPAILAHDKGVAVVDVRINGDYLNPASRDIAQHLS
jgi:thiamine pyrophosphate-dependent acetolactate synthase large subunit-like protein